jgi:hypothetical protein
MTARNKDVRRERIVFGFHCRKLSLNITDRRSEPFECVLKACRAHHVQSKINPNLTRAKACAALRSCGRKAQGLPKVSQGSLSFISQAIKELMETYVKYPPPKLQSMSYDGPIELSKYQKFQWLRDQLGKEGVNIPLPTAN